MVLSILWNCWDIFERTCSHYPFMHNEVLESASPIASRSQPAPCSITSLVDYLWLLLL